MKKDITNRVEMMERVQHFLTDHPLTTPIARVTELATLINTVVTTLRAQDRDQDTGRNEIRAVTVARREAAKGLRGDMRRVSQVSKGLSREQYPGLAELLRMPQDSYAALFTRAQAFLEVTGPIKAALIARGLPADFDEQLQGKAVVFAALAERRDRGRAEQIGATAGMKAMAKIGVAHVAELDSMLRPRYADDPVLQAAWKAAKRIRRPNSSPQAGSTPTPTPAPTPTPTPAPTP